MARINTRTALKEYIMRKLGHPVINVNLAPEQLEDAVNDAFLYFSDYHYEGSERTFIARKITQEDLDNRWIPTPSNVMTVMKVYKPNDTAFGTSIGDSLFDLQYHFFRNEIFELTRSGSQLSNFHIVMQYIAEMNGILNYELRFRYTGAENKLYIDADWSKRFSVDKYVVYEAVVRNDPEVDAPFLYDHWVVKKLAMLEAKKQWGLNLMKFTGVQLPGGISMNGERIYSDADKELEEFKASFQTNFQEPLELQIG
jgi:hypothetical protein